MPDRGDGSAGLVGGVGGAADYGAARLGAAGSFGCIAALPARWVAEFHIFNPFPMRMHSLRLALVAAALAATSGAAQATPRQEAPAQGRPRGGGDRFKDLNLSDDQKAKMDALMKEAREQRGSQQGPPSDADRQAMQTRRAEMDTKIKGILTPEQYTKYQAMRPQGGRGGQRPQGSGE
jgi:Spy/CpxP family protein refolding chaperone